MLLDMAAGSPRHALFRTMSNYFSDRFLQNCNNTRLA